MIENHDITTFFLMPWTIIDIKEIFKTKDKQAAEIQIQSHFTPYKTLKIFYKNQKNFSSLTLGTEPNALIIKKKNLKNLSYQEKIQRAQAVLQNIFNKSNQNIYQKIQNILIKDYHAITKTNLFFKRQRFQNIITIIVDSTATSKQITNKEHKNLCKKIQKNIPKDMWIKTENNMIYSHHQIEFKGLYLKSQPNNF